MIIGITGKSGSGKSTIARKIYGARNVIEIDEIGHRALENPGIQKEIEKRFGIKYASCHRKEIGDLVFTNRHKMAELTEITWGYMEQVIDQFVMCDKLVVLDWILLPKTKYFKMCDLKILVKAGNEDERIKAVLARDGISKEYLRKRDSSGIEYDESQFDYIVINNYKGER